MEPISAMVVAALVTWGTAGGGIKDTTAIAKGQTPPSYAHRAAKREAHERAAERDRAVIAQHRERGEPLPPVLEGRRIRLGDLARHWWEDALEDADHWRSVRHDSRPERKAKRKAWRQKKKEQIARGYQLLKARAEERFGDQDEQDQQDQEEPQGSDEETGPGADEVPDNVVPLHRQDAPGGLPDMSPEQEDRLQHTLERAIEAKNRGLDGAVEALIEAYRRDHDTDDEEQSMIDLSDAPTLDAHTRALESYASYLDQIASDMDALAAGMAQHKMGQIAINAVTTAGVANSEAAADVRQRKQELLGAHTPVADARAAAPDAADGDYLTRGR